MHNGYVVEDKDNGTNVEMYVDDICVFFKNVEEADKQLSKRMEDLYKKAHDLTLQSQNFLRDHRHLEQKYDQLKIMWRQAIAQNESRDTTIQRLEQSLRTARAQLKALEEELTQCRCNKGNGEGFTITKSERLPIGMPDNDQGSEFIDCKVNYIFKRTSSTGMSQNFSFTLERNLDMDNFCKSNVVANSIHRMNKEKRREFFKSVQYNQTWSSITAFKVVDNKLILTISDKRSENLPSWSTLPDNVLQQIRNNFRVYFKMELNTDNTIRGEGTAGGYAGEGAAGGHAGEGVAGGHGD